MLLLMLHSLLTKHGVCFVRKLLTRGCEPAILSELHTEGHVAHRYRLSFYSRYQMFCVGKRQANIQKNVLKCELNCEKDSEPPSPYRPASVIFH